MRGRALGLVVAVLAAVPTLAAPAAPPPAAPALPAAGESWLIDQIKLGAVTPAQLMALRDDHTMAAVAAHLDKLGVGYVRALRRARAADLPAPLVAQVRTLPRDEPFVVPDVTGFTINVVVPDRPGVAAPTWALVPVPPVTGAAAPRPGEPQLAAARRFIEAALPAAEREHYFARLADIAMANMVTGIARAQHLDVIMAAHPALRPVFTRFISRQRDLALADLHAHMPELIEAETLGYARLFTPAELDRLSAFFATPLGRKYLVESQALAAQPEMAAWQQALAARAQARMPAELQALAQQVQSAMAKEKPASVS